MHFSRQTNGEGLNPHPPPPPLRTPLLKSSKIGLSSARGQHYLWIVEISLENARNLAENLQRSFFWFPQVEIVWKKIFKDLFRQKKIFEDLFFWNRLKKFFEDLFFFFWRTLASVSFVLGLERVCPWPWLRTLCLRLHLWWYNYETIWTSCQSYG